MFLPHLPHSAGIAGVRHHTQPIYILNNHSAGMRINYRQTVIEVGILVKKLMGNSTDEMEVLRNAGF